MVPGEWPLKSLGQRWKDLGIDNFYSVRYAPVQLPLLCTPLAITEFVALVRLVENRGKEYSSFSQFQLPLLVMWTNTEHLTPLALWHLDRSHNHLDLHWS